MAHTHPKKGFEKGRFAVALHGQRQGFHHDVRMCMHHTQDSCAQRTSSLKCSSVSCGLCTCPPTTTISGTASVSPKATAERCSALHGHTEVRITSTPHVRYWYKPEASVASSVALQHGCDDAVTSGHAVLLVAIKQVTCISPVRLVPQATLFVVIHVR